MPFFTFSLKKNFLNSEQFPHIPINKIKQNHTYFSKNTFLWKHLNKSQYYENINFLLYEKRHKNTFLKKKILFCLPPSLGLGDLIEYAIFIQKLIDSNNFTKVGIAFVGRYEFILNKYFSIQNIYSDIISEDDLSTFETIFHFTLEIEELKKQKYIRQDIEKILKKYFKINDSYSEIKLSKKMINKITIFPVSQSPIRSMTAKVINTLIKFYEKKYLIDVVLDNHSEISNYIESNLTSNYCNILKPQNIEELSNVIEDIDFGIFMDSGPLHLAKLIGKRGVLIITSVGDEILLNNNSNIIPIKNQYTSNYCKAPCGLTNTFTYNGKSGCYNSLELKKEDFLKIKNLNSLQRGRNKDSYIKLMSEPVGCVNKINTQMLLQTINNILKI